MHLHVRALEPSFSVRKHVLHQIWILVAKPANTTPIICPAHTKYWLCPQVNWYDDALTFGVLEPSLGVRRHVLSQVLVLFYHKFVSVGHLLVYVNSNSNFTLLIKNLYNVFSCVNGKHKNLELVFSPFV